MVISELIAWKHVDGVKGAWHVMLLLVIVRANYVSLVLLQQTVNKVKQFM